MEITEDEITGDVAGDFFFVSSVLGGLGSPRQFFQYCALTPKEN